MSDVEIPEGTTEITEETFRNHRMISSVKIPESVLVIGDKAFADCVNLKKITLPSGLMAIGKYAFYNCAALESIVIPEEVRTIEECTFKNCECLESVVLGENITSIKSEAFANCTGIKQLDISDNLISCASNAFPNSRKYLTINSNYKSENGLLINTVNGLLLFYDGEEKTVKVPSCVKGIAFRAFYGTSLDVIRLSEGVKSVNDEAFVNCGTDVSVVLPESIDFIENRAFGPCVKIFCRKGSYSESWCRNNPDCRQLEDEVF